MDRTQCSMWVAAAHARGPLSAGSRLHLTSVPRYWGEINGSQCSARGQNQKWPTYGHSGYLTPAPGLTPRNITRAFSRSPR